MAISAVNTRRRHAHWRTRLTPFELTVVLIVSVGASALLMTPLILLAMYAGE